MTARNHWLAVAGIALATIVTFHSVLLPPRPVVANDSPTANVMVGRQWWESGRSVLWLTDGYLGRNGGVMTYGLTTPFQRWLPPEYFNTALFALFTFVTGVGCYLFLVSLGLSPLAGFTGACALMLSGDFITCVFSGHLGKFTMWAFLMLSLWLLTLGITRRSIVAMLWCGICTGIGVSGQLDVGFIVCLFYAAWAALLLWQTRESKKWPRMAAGFAVAAVAAFLYSSMTVVSLLGLANQGASNASEEERSPQEKWNWATQWSLPKQETLTFIAPGFYGFGHSGDSPYWGRIGQDANWPAQHQGFPRFSINTQGLGVVAIGLALFAVMAGILVERRPSPEAEAPRTTDHRSPITDYRPVVMFWAVAAVVALVFAWGRYLDMSPHGANGFGPYRLFYMLPKMDAMRNPLKFLYPMMLSVAVLAAFGMQYLSQQPAKQGKSGARRTR